MILVLRALGLGDLATAVPALRGLRAAFPGEEIALAAPGWLAPLVPLTGAVDRHIAVPGLNLPQWTLPERPALSVNLHGRGPQSHRLLAVAGAPRMWAWALPGEDGPLWTADEHEVDRWCRLLREHRVETDRDDLDLLPPPTAGPPGLTIVHPGAKAAARRWPVDRFAAVARELTARGHTVVVTGSAVERGLAERVAAGAGLPRSAVLAGDTDVGDLAALVCGARLVVAGDTGIGHLATAYRIPSVLLFGPVAPRLWGPPADRPWHRALHPPATGDPVDGVDPRLAAVSVADVVRAAELALTCAPDRPVRR
ncbi:glycosyltransferase family 9 protein [Asanoa sp. WMMD1127]|uniref:glycosyltransferase family 9 protein n=1 Tax=Asanoa sp. WMMD1127 TaxID=3016107 RepID=UPI002415BB9E|nr:glycosyltransferase family 9 protein [Asanoa sp. WMMD1127]MDG4825809.1 glycosyltransferase family 9 protein [Asanoa sp. WMMD1127]